MAGGPKSYMRQPMGASQSPNKQQMEKPQRCLSLIGPHQCGLLYYKVNLTTRDTSGVCISVYILGHALDSLQYWLAILHCHS